MDKEKVIKGLQNLRDAIAFDYIRETDHAVETLDNAIAMLKEQEDLGTELTNAVELIHKKNERIEKLLKEQEAVEPKPLGNNRFACGSCSNPLWVYHQRFCASCGQEVKWE